MSKVFTFLAIFISIDLSFSQTFALLQSPVTSTKGDGRSANFLDINGDGWDDIFISNGPENGAVNYLYLNDGKGNYLSTKEGDIAQYTNPSDGASFSDFDNDGDADAVVVSWYGHEDFLYANDGKGVLNYVASNGLDKSTYAETAAFGDYNNDRLLDLYITISDGDKKNILYKNMGNGKFEKVKDSPLTNDAKASRGAIWTDVNNDGKIDLFVVNEGNNTKDLFINKGNSNFEKQANKLTASTKSTMTSSWGDLDNDGDMDVFLGTAGYYATIKNQLFVNEGLDFRELASTALSETATCTYGSAFADYDNDGDMDIFVSNGFCKSALKNMLFENKGNFVFEDVSNKLLYNEAVCSYGAAWGDANNDGFMDILVANCNNDAFATQSPSSLLINSGNDNHWLKVVLHGVESNRDGIGAKVKIKCKVKDVDVWQVREIQSQSGYAGQNAMYAHFGVADAVTIDSVVILWPSGIEQELSNIDANQIVNVTEKKTVDTKEIIDDSYVSVIPNLIKSGENIHIKMTSPSKDMEVKILIINSFGQEVYSNLTNVVSFQKNYFDVSIQLNPGLYLLAMYENGYANKLLGSTKFVVK